MNVVKINLAGLLPDPKNTRKHDRRNIDAIKESLRKFGQYRPFVVQRQGMIIRVGNGMYQAMKELGWSDGDAEIKDLTNDEAVALSIIDNRSSELAVWDDELLAKTLNELPSEYKTLTGFDDAEINKMLRAFDMEGEVQDSEVQIEKADELQKEWKTKLGQIWTMGEHLLACGDSSDESLVKRIIGTSKASCMFTDPPYGVSIGDKNAMLNTFQPSGRCLTNLEADTMKPEDLKKMLVKVFSCANKNALSDSCAVYVCAPQGGGLGMMMMMMMESGLEVRHILNWIKNSPTFSMGRLDYDYQHEPILYTWTKRHECKRAGPFRTSLWKVDKPRKCGEHPTMKPVELYLAAYKDSCARGDVVFEPFSGSGTAFVVAEQMGLKCRGVELMPRFVAVALQRWKDLTGEEPACQE